MTGSEVIKMVRESGGCLSLDGDDIVLDMPVTVPTDQLEQELRNCKAELIKILRGGGQSQEKDDSALSRSTDIIEVQQRLSGKGPGWVVIKSELLSGESVVWVRDESVRVPEVIKDLVCYTWDEIGILLDTSPEVVRKVHISKRILGTTVLSSEPRTWVDNYRGSGASSTSRSLVLG